MDKKNKAICDTIEKCIDKGWNNFAIYPFGINGINIKNILNNRYNIMEKYIIDNNLAKYRNDVVNIKAAKELISTDTKILVSVDDVRIYDEIMESLNEYFLVNQYVCVFERPVERNYPIVKKTIIGKYSGGPLAESNHPFIKAIGAFCSFAQGVDVVPNHPMNYVSTHPFLYGANRKGDIENEEPFTYKDSEQYRWFFPGVDPRGEVECKRITIGNDVWLGKNVIITNYSNIGNGVIAGAGAVITRNVPNYAIVAGVPARIIGYRFTEKQICEMEKIEWWNWSDEEIVKYYEDFFDPIDVFIQKHSKK